MARTVIRRPEMNTATLRLGGPPIALSDYATTGLLGVVVAPRGHGKTNAGLVMAEQLAEQGWVCVLIDPEDELAGLYGKAVANPEALRKHLVARDKPIIVVAAHDAEEFSTYGSVITEVADEHRKAMFVLVDEGQLFSGSRRKDIEPAAKIINDFAERGRKRAIDLCITALRYTGSLHRTIFANKNLTLIGCQEDPTAWSGLSAQFRGSHIGFADLQALSPGEFLAISRRGIERLHMPMAEALQAVAPKAAPAMRTVPATFRQWASAMEEIPTDRLNKLTDPVVTLLGSVAGLSSQQMLSGIQALHDELELRR